MNRSTYETMELWNCPSCYFADFKKIQEAKEHHEAENWLRCSEVKGWCGFSFRHTFNSDFTKCLDHRHIDTGELTYDREETT